VRNRHNAQGSLPPECANSCAVAHISSAGANGETACRLLVFGGSVSDGVAVRDYAASVGRMPLPHVLCRPCECTVLISAHFLGPKPLLLLLLFYNMLMRSKNNLTLPCPLQMEATVMPSSRIQSLMKLLLSRWMPTRRSARMMVRVRKKNRRQGLQRHRQKGPRKNATNKNKK
jgi:hypothetical protein